jgi:DNA-binding GntR family transcriptional regulator
VLDGLYKPGDRLLEADLAAAFHVSRSPVREALQALENEGTLFAAPYSGAMVRPLSAVEASEIADIRLGLISLAIKPAHPHLAPAHFDLADDLAKRITRTKSAREAFECAGLRRTGSACAKAMADRLGRNWHVVHGSTHRLGANTHKDFPQAARA